MYKLFGRRLSPEEFSAEIVRRAHVDRLANGVAEDVSCYIRDNDPDARTDLNCALTRYVDRDTVMIWGEVYSNGKIPTEERVSEMVTDYIKQVGYDASTGFNHRSFGLQLAIKQQSNSLTANANSWRAGDTRTVWGFASKYRDTYFGSQTLSAAEQICRRLVDRLDEQAVFLLNQCGYHHDILDESGIPYPDGKLTVKFVRDEDIYVTCQLQHGTRTDIRRLEEYVYDNIFFPVVKELHLERFRHRLNINGGDSRVQFVNGGTRADSGTSNHKLLVYGEALPTGGGGPWGKDFSKPEKFGWLMARHIAHSIVSQDIAEVVKIGLGYEIGLKLPRVFIHTYGTLRSEYRDDEHLAALIESKFDLTPESVVDSLNLRDTQTFRRGVRNHIFGNPEFRWEQSSKID